ncbi:hypothetical protein [Bifidobacterium breve]|uniref:hypothetical protein n=1 Tax=Bifidobacterium breve TaxID=1685 RepID=UPI0022B02F6B|nr:hypothetical protein [Bifidobacterium breve]MCZ4465737.1 hypothetical protein [Bifidobacterium breve]MCZ4468484.1 hypothetical protein [Bifidobacterium breve]MCZ4472324.1 hypothetical protein [Bifidobacterium breve]
MGADRRLLNAVRTHLDKHCTHDGYTRVKFGVLANSVGLRWVPRKQFHDGEAYRASNMATARTLSAALGELSTNGEITFHMSAIGMAAEVQLLHSADQGSFDLGL